MTAAFRDVLTEPAQLDALYRSPSQLVRDKVIDRLDDGCQAFVAASTFVLIGTADAHGRCDVSPKGGPAGFVKVLDAARLVIPDLNGNNRLDSLRNVIAAPQIGLLFVIPGRGETLRVNGKAWVTTDPEVLDLFTAELRRPTTAIGVQVAEAYLHCAKAFLRGGMWDPQAWPDAGAAPSSAALLREHVGLTDVDVAAIAEALEESYVKGLETDRPTPSGV